MAILYDNSLCNMYIKTYSNADMFISTPGFDVYLISNYESPLNLTNLVSYWSFDNTLIDHVTGLNPIGGTGYSYTFDRHSKPSSAISFNNGYLQLQNDVYFYGDFTVTVWVV